MLLEGGQGKLKAEGWGAGSGKKWRKEANDMQRPCGEEGLNEGEW